MHACFSIKLNSGRIDSFVLLCENVPVFRIETLLELWHFPAKTDTQVAK